MGTERTESQGFYEMLWDCDHCGTKGLLGKSQRHCPECGAKQNPALRYFPPEGAATRVEGHAYEGADVYCPACNAAMGAKAKSCANCGAPMDGSTQVRGVLAAAPAAPKRRNWKLIVAIVAAVVGVIVLVWFVFFRTKEAVLKVTAHEWSRSIAIEEYSDLHEESWRDTMPRDARMPVCRLKQKSTRQVPDGETCRDEKVDKQDGTYEVVTKCKPKTRSVPVDAEWCSYTVTRWHDVDVRKVGGTGLSLAWPTMDLPPATAAQLPGARRQGRRSESRSLLFGSQRCDNLSDATWRKYTDGQSAKVAVRARSGAIVCDSL